MTDGNLLLVTVHTIYCAPRHTLKNWATINWLLSRTRFTGLSELAIFNERNTLKWISTASGKR